jgi:hypothetical protein
VRPKLSSACFTFLLSFVNASYRRLLFPLTLAPSHLRVPASSLSWSCQKVERCFQRQTSHTFLDLPTHKYSSADLPKHLLPLNFLQCRSHPRQVRTASEWAGTRKPRRYRGVPVVTCRCFLRSPLREIWICVIVIIQQVVVPRDTSSFLCHRECTEFELLTAPSQLGEPLLQRKARSKGARPAMDYAASALHNTLRWQVL